MSTPPQKLDHADKNQDLGNGYIIERHLAGYSYPQNGNLHNPTPRYRWNLYLNGKLVDSDDRRSPLREGARRDDYR